MCQRKWQTHTTTYKNIKEKNSKTGRGRDSWEYFDEMESIFSKDPSYVPLATISCGVKPVERNIDESLIDKNLDMPGEGSSTDEPTPKNIKKIQKKKVSDQLQNIGQQMAEFNAIFKTFVQAENDKNALLKQLLDKQT